MATEKYKNFVMIYWDFIKQYVNGRIHAEPNYMQMK